jgi:hypothetical protein
MLTKAIVKAKIKKYRTDIKSNFRAAIPDERMQSCLCDIVDACDDEQFLELAIEASKHKKWSVVLVKFICDFAVEQKILRSKHKAFVAATNWPEEEEEPKQ